jgi:hypothetical protein
VLNGWYAPFFVQDPRGYHPTDTEVKVSSSATHCKSDSADIQPRNSSFEDCVQIEYISEEQGYGAVSAECTVPRAMIYEHVMGCLPCEIHNGTSCVQLDLCQAYPNLCEPYPGSTCSSDPILGYTCQCPNATFRNDTQDACIPCTPCSSSQFETVPCTTTSDSICQLCSTCSSGFYEIATCTNTSDRLCTTCRAPCDSASYEATACNRTSDRSCASCQVCLPGFTEMAACNSITSRDRVCQDVTPPSLELVGDLLMLLEYGQAYVDPGFAAMDREARLNEAAVTVTVPLLGPQVCMPQTPQFYCHLRVWLCLWLYM